MRADYATRLKRHLVNYKRRILGVSEDGVWKRNGRSYSHILPEEERALNLLEPMREDFLAELSRTGISLHRDFHHLNSSQAMCFNLFYPFVRGKAASGALLSALYLPATPIDSWAFEYEPDPDERTNFDFYLSLVDQTQVFFELKLTESKFGSARDDERHRQKLERIYRPRLAELVEPDALKPEFFFEHYQLLRNISYLTSDRSLLYLVFPLENELLEAPVAQVLAVVKPEHRDRIRVISLEQLMSGLASRPLTQELRTHLELFAEKYFPPAG